MVGHEEYNIDLKSCGPMILDALIKIKDEAMQRLKQDFLAQGETDSGLQVDTTLTFRRRNSDCQHCQHKRCISFPLMLSCSLQILSRGNLWILCLGPSMHHVVYM